VGGGVITLAIALSWRRLFPSVARIDRLQEIRPAGEPDLHPGRELPQT
jgi:hypothetical protein